MTSLIWLGATLLLLLSLAPYAPKSNLVTDTPAHFALQWAIGSAVLLAVAILFHVHGQVYLVLLISYFLSLHQLFPYLKGRKKAAGNSGATLKILQANVWIRNHEPGRLRQLIHDENPDIIAAAEVHSPFFTLFEEMKSAYPHQRVIVKNDSSFGAAVLSKLPFENLEEKHLAAPGIPSLFFRISAGGKPLDVVVMHAENPLKSIRDRDAEFAALARWQEETGSSRLILAGDLNATPYCTALKQLTRRMDLVNARMGRGLMGSYPVWMKLPFLRIPIDHVLASTGVIIEDFRLGPSIGSDHLPTLTVIRL